MYAIICIVGKDHYERATKDDFPTIEEARTYKATISKSLEPLIIPDYALDDAIQINNERLEKEAN